MADTNVKLPIKELTKQVTMNVTIVGYSGWLIRLKIACMLIKLAARIGGMGIRIEDAWQETETNGEEET